MSSLPSLLQQLEQRIAALEQRATGVSEPWTPTYLTSNANGTIGANFTGHVHAQGLDLDAAALSTPPTVDQIRWLRTSDGAAIASLAAYGSDPGGGRSMFVAANAVGPADSSAAYLRAVDDTNTTQAQLGVTQSQRTSAAIQAYVAGAGTKTILDQAAQSDFLQLLSTQKLRIAMGNATTPAPSPASTESPLQMVNHGLGAVPQIVLTQNTGGADGNVLSQRWDTSVNSTTQFGVRTESNAAFSFAVGFSWIALG